MADESSCSSACCSSTRVYWIPLLIVSARSKSVRVILGREAQVRERDSELAHFLLKTLPIHSGAFRGARDIAAGRAQRANKKITFPVADKFFLRLAKGRRQFAAFIARRRVIRASDCGRGVVALEF